MKGGELGGKEWLDVCDRVMRRFPIEHRQIGQEVGLEDRTFQQEEGGIIRDFKFLDTMRVTVDDAPLGLIWWFRLLTSRSRQDFGSKNGELTESCLTVSTSSASIKHRRSGVSERSLRQRLLREGSENARHV